MSVTEIENSVDQSIITITTAAVKQMKFLRGRKGEPGMGVRVGVKGGGCSGLSYTIALESNTYDNDIVIALDDINVYIDTKCTKFLVGTTLDYSVKNLLEGGWVFNNPNASRTCGCGTSFQPK